MSDHPRKVRRAALRVLYAIDLSGQPPDQALATVGQALREDGDDPRQYWRAVTERVKSVIAAQERLDQEIQTLSPTWRIDRMAAVDRNILRLGIFEILESITSPLVAINACVELAKEFGTKSTPGFINGLLDQLCQNHGISL